MTTRHYDVVVLGGRMSATIMAALLGKRGMRGLLIDQGELASLEGRLLADVVFAETGSLAMELVHSELGIREDLKNKTHWVTPTFQAIFSDERLDIIGHDRDHLAKELTRAFKAHAEPLFPTLAALDELDQKVGAYLANAGELPPSGFFGKRAALASARRHSELAQSLEASGLFNGIIEELREVFLAPLPFLTHIDAKTPADVSVARFARTLGRFMGGLGMLEDKKSVRELFLEVAKRKGFEIKRSAVESIDPSKVIQIKVVGQREDLITADVLIDCSGDLSGIETIPHKSQAKELSLMLQSAKPKGFLHAISIEVDADVVPPGLADYAFLLNGRRDRSRLDSNDPDAEDRPILLSRRASAKAKDRVELVAVHPISATRAHAGGIERLEEAIRARVERLMPFLPEGKPEIIPLSRGASRPFLHHPLFEGDLDPVAGLVGVPMRTVYKNVFLAGPVVMPGLGVEGEYLSALQAADACETYRGGQKRPKTLAARTPSLIASSTTP